MKRENQPFPEELASAIEDLHRIRQAMDAAQAVHPLRLIVRPWLGYAPVLGLVIMAFGVGAQLLLERGGASVLGVAPSTIVGTLGVALLLVAWVAKLWVIGRASQRAGFGLVDVLVATFDTDYLRILVPGGLTIWLGAAALGHVGGHEMVLGFAIAGVGALMIPLASAQGLWELAPIGGLMFALGAAAMVLIPQWPFYTLAVSWGLALVVGGWVARSRLPALPAEA